MRKKLEAALDTERRKLNKTTNELCQARTSLDIAKKAGEKKDQDQERERLRLKNLIVNPFTLFTWHEDVASCDCCKL